MWPLSAPIPKDSPDRTLKSPETACPESKTSKTYLIQSLSTSKSHNKSSSTKRPKPSKSPNSSEDNSLYTSTTSSVDRLPSTKSKSTKPIISSSSSWTLSTTRYPKQLSTKKSILLHPWPITNCFTWQTPKLPSYKVCNNCLSYFSSLLKLTLSSLWICGKYFCS